MSSVELQHIVEYFPWLAAAAVVVAENRLAAVVVPLYLVYLAYMHSVPDSVWQLAQRWATHSMDSLALIYSAIVDTTKKRKNRMNFMLNCAKTLNFGLKKSGKLPVRHIVLATVPIAFGRFAIAASFVVAVHIAVQRSSDTYPHWLLALLLQPLEFDSVFAITMAKTFYSDFFFYI